MSDDNQSKSETAGKTHVVDGNGKDVELGGDNFTLYRHKPIVVSAWKLPYMVQVTTTEGEMIGDIGDWLVVGIDHAPFICKSGVFDMHYSPVTNPPETEPGLASNETTEPDIAWLVSLHCEIPMKPSVFLTAWQSRLASQVAVIDYDTSDEKTTVFDVTTGVEASNNAKACNMASNLLKRHFEQVKVTEIHAEQR